MAKVHKYFDHPKWKWAHQYLDKSCLNHFFVYSTPVCFGNPNTLIWEFKLAMYLIKNKTKYKMCVLFTIALRCPLCPVCWVLWRYNSSMSVVVSLQQLRDFTQLTVQLNIVRRTKSSLWWNVFFHHLFMASFCCLTSCQAILYFWQGTVLWWCSRDSCIYLVSLIIMLLLCYYLLLKQYLE